MLTVLGLTHPIFMCTKLTLWPLLGVVSACSHRERESVDVRENQLPLTRDTLVGRKTISDEIPGSAYRKRALGYFLIINSDTSDFVCILTESKDSGKVSMNIRYERRTMTYRQRMEELKRIISEASRDFNFDSLRSLYLGRLVFNGDIAVDVTRQYQEQFGKVDRIADYIAVSEFLRKSKLAADLNDLFSPYSVSVRKVSPEKLFFTSKTELFWASKVETDSVAIPEKILDCIVWIEMGSHVPNAF